MTFAMPSGLAPFSPLKNVRLEIDGSALEAPRPGSDRSWRVAIHREGGEWKLGALPAGPVRKRHGLQGPIDDAFMDAFLMVLPSGTPMNEAVGAWAKGESERALKEWRREFRGDAPQKPDKDVTSDDIRSRNLILWGDPRSNEVLAKIADRLPIHWTQEGIEIGKDKYGAADHVLVLICPNPLNPERYVVINSGFTFREYDYLNNARQTPKLPDWAVLDITRPPTPRRPGEIKNAGFFGENWELK